MSKPATPKSPLPLFDDIEHFEEHRGEQHLAALPTLPVCALEDYNKAHGFLKSYRGSQGTFNSYRREVERLLHWSWGLSNKSIKALRPEDLEAFIQFCQNPPVTWIGVKKAPRFIEAQGQRQPNVEWRPFVVAVSKSAHRKGLRPEIKNFELSGTSIKESLAILSSFYNYLLQEEYAPINPIALIRQKSKYIRKYQGSPKIRRLSELQWQYLIETAQGMAEAEPSLHERTLFILSALYSLYLRVSELAASPRFTPLMNHFYKDHEGNWWFTTVGKGNKERQIAVSDAMLEALKRWRRFLNLSALPAPSDTSALIPKLKGKGPIKNITYIREIVQNCFDQAIAKLNEEGFQEEAESLMEATVHWLRHTGISDDVKRRPREHVRDDAGHSSSAITDKYIDIELRERYRSAKHKPI